ncbi:MAG: DMT family transporter [Candidatus Hermodarchaeota archaeon]
MSNNIKKGIIFGILGNIFVGLQPIVANSRPDSIDAYIFAAMTCLVEAVIFIPLMLIEIKLNRLKARKNNLKASNHNSILKNWKKNLRVFLFIGLLFGLNQFLFFIGYKLAEEINGALTQKTTVFFGLIFGYLILKEKITKIQILYSIILFFGLVIAITQFPFNFETVNSDIILGVLTLLFVACLWMLGHTITKPIFSRNEATPTQMVFIRNILSGSILFSTYFIFFPLQNLTIFLDPINYLYFFAMGGVYSLGLFCWYKTLSYLDLSKATILLSPTPIVTAIFATFIRNAIFTIFHFIGTIIIIISIILIMRLKRN